jgi:hypothetical protein
MADPLRTEELHERLRRHVLGKDDPQGGRAYLFRELAFGERRADAFSFGLWASRGFPIQGYEVKSNREDWLREYEDHAKADPVMEVADRFWLVTNPDVVLDGELPDSWGLLLAQGRNRKLKIAKPAPLLREGAGPIDRAIMAELLKGIKGLHYAAAEEIRQRAIENTDPSGEVAASKARQKEAEERAKRLSDAYQAFRREAGMDFLKWHPEHEELEVLGKLVKALRGGAYSDEFDALRERLKRDRARMQEASRYVKRAAEAMDEMEERAWRAAGKDEGGF